MITDRRSVFFPEGVAPVFKSCFSSLFRIPGPAGSDPSAYFAEPPVLETADLTLRPVRMKDADDIFRYASDPEVARYVLWDPHRSLAETRRVVRGLCRRAREGWPSSWAVTSAAPLRVML